MDKAEFVLERKWMAGGYRGIPEEYFEQWRFGNWVMVRNLTRSLVDWEWSPAEQPCKIAAIN